MSARKSAANCYVGSYKRGGPNSVAARASTNRCAWVRVGVVQCCCIHTSLRIGPSTLPVCRFVSERSRQTASVAGCWEARGIPNLAAPAVRARSKSDTESLASFELESCEFERESASVQCKFDRHRGKNYTTTSIQCEAGAFGGDYLRAVSWPANNAFNFRFLRVSSGLTAMPSTHRRSCASETL